MPSFKSFRTKKLLVRIGYRRRRAICGCWVELSGEASADPDLTARSQAKKAKQNRPIPVSRCSPQVCATVHALPSQHAH